MTTDSIFTGSLIVFLIICVPFVVALSIENQRDGPTDESARLRKLRERLLRDAEKR